MHFVAAAGVALFALMGVAFVQQSGWELLLIAIIAPPFSVYIMMTVIAALLASRKGPKWIAGYAGFWVALAISMALGWPQKTSNLVHMWASVPTLHPRGTDDPAFCQRDGNGRYFVLTGPWGVDDSAWYVYDPDGPPKPRTHYSMPAEINAGSIRGWEPITGNWLRVYTKGYHWPKDETNCP